MAAGTDSKGRKFVVFTNTVKSPNIVGDKRPMGSMFTLISKDDKYTDIQKDVIRIFSDSSNAKYAGEDVLASPVSIAAIKSDDAACNLTALTSGIHSWAQHSKEADIDKILSQDGSIKLLL